MGFKVIKTNLPEVSKKVLPAIKSNNWGAFKIDKLYLL